MHLWFLRRVWRTIDSFVCGFVNSVVYGSIFYGLMFYVSRDSNCVICRDGSNCVICRDGSDCVICRDGSNCVIYCDGYDCVIYYSKGYFVPVGLQFMFLVYLVMFFMTSHKLFVKMITLFNKFLKFIYNMKNKFK